MDYWTAFFLGKTPFCNKAEPDLFRCWYAATLNQKFEEALLGPKGLTKKLKSSLRPQIHSYYALQWIRRLRTQTSRWTMSREICRTPPDAWSTTSNANLYTRFTIWKGLRQLENTTCARNANRMTTPQPSFSERAPQTGGEMEIWWLRRREPQVNINPFRVQHKSSRRAVVNMPNRMHFANEPTSVVHCHQRQSLKNENCVDTNDSVLDNEHLFKEWWAYHVLDVIFLHKQEQARRERRFGTLLQTYTFYIFSVRYHKRTLLILD